MNLRINLNNNWLFTEQYDEKLLNADYESKDLKQIRIPHTCKETPFHYFSESVYQMICGYRKSLYIEKEWKGKRLLLTFEGAGHIAEVFIGGNKVGEHRSGYTAFTMDISEYVDYGQDNYIVVRLNTSEDSNIPPFGYMVDYMTYGGIYRDVYLDVKPEIYIEDVFVKSKLLQVQQEKQIEPWNESDVEFETAVTISGNLQGISIRQYIGEELIWENKASKNKYLTNEDLTNIDSRNEEIIKEDWGHEASGNEGNKQECPSRSNGTMSYKYNLTNQKVWDVEHPHLYRLTTQLVASGIVIDEKITTIGFRKSEFRTDGYYLNGRKLKIRGLNRHQSYPYVGYAMPQSMQELDARILKQELGVNAVRTSHYPQSHYFLEECDRLGLLVFTEIPGWQHIGDEEWKKQALKNVKEMVLQYRNHTSIILWGVRINESQDDEEFYRRTNEMAHKLDDTRPTGGVRAHKKSQMFEDVYTYNDFLHNGKTKGCDKKKVVTSDPSKPYLVTEYMGHMFPTKSFDCEEHRVEHALRHATVLDAIAGESDICGSFAWCMFDYNTHKDFGSGDRICYHGVMDMFRNPKYAAAVYESQGEEHPVLEVATSMDIGEHPGCNRGYTYIFTNADSVRMYKNDLFIKEFNTKNPDYQNLKHPPVLIDDFIGEQIAENENVTAKQAKMISKAMNATAKEGVYNLPLSIKWIGVKLVLFHRMKLEQMVVLYNKYVGDWGKKATTYRFEAVKDNEIVKTVSKSPMNEINLSVQADHTHLKENISYDVSAIRIKAVDENGNTLSFYNDLVRFEVEGPIEIIGPDTVTFSGGMTGTYIKTIGEAGAAVLRVISGGVQKEVLLNVELLSADSKKRG